MVNIPMMFKVAFGLVALSLILFLAGFGSNFWFTSNTRSTFHFGLWAICSSSGCYSYDRVLAATPGHAYVGRLCTIYELVAVVLGLVFICIFVFKNPKPTLIKSGYALILSGGVIGLLGAIVFIAREESTDTRDIVNVGWSGILVIIAAIIQIVAAILIILPIRRGEIQFDQV